MPRPRRSHTIAQKTSHSYTKQNPDIFYTQEDIGAETNECRICLQGQQQNNRLISPCKCTGSVQYIHQQCLKQWIQKNRQKRINPIRCELCKQIFLYSIIVCRECNSFDVVRDKIRINYKIFLFLLFLFLINCGVTVYLIVIFVHVLEMSAGSPKFIQIGVISFSIVLLLVISSILVGILVKEFVYEEKRKVDNILCLDKRPRHKNSLDNSLSIQTKYNGSKTKIHPIQITQIAQIQEVS